MQSNIGFVKFSYFCIFPNVTPTLLLSYFVNVLLLVHDDATEHMEKFSLLEVFNKIIVTLENFIII